MVPPTAPVLSAFARQRWLHSCIMPDARDITMKSGIDSPPTAFNFFRLTQKSSSMPTDKVGFKDPSAKKPDIHMICFDTLAASLSNASSATWYPSS